MTSNNSGNTQGKNNASLQTINRPELLELLEALKTNEITKEQGTINKGIRKSIDKTVEEHGTTIQKHDTDIGNLDKAILALKGWIIAAITIMGINLIYWIYESYFHTNELHMKYEVQTKEFENIIKLFEKEISELKSDNKRTEQELQYLRERFDHYVDIKQTHP